MIVAVFCVAAAMIASGAWAVFTGWELIIIERGWTQVLLGGMLITGGLLLGGIGVLATHVKRLAKKLDEMPRNGAAPSLVADFRPGERNEPTAMKPTRPEPPPMPIPPRPELRVEPRVAAVAEPKEPEPEPREKPAISDPAAIALGAAAGAGTAAIASAILSSGPEQRAAEDTAGREAQAEKLSEEASGEVTDVDQLFPESETAERAAVEDEIPSPDGEDAELLRVADGADADASGGSAMEAGALGAEDDIYEAALSRRSEPAMQAEAEDIEHVIPPIEEPPTEERQMEEPQQAESQLEDRGIDSAASGDPLQTAPEHKAEPEELYSAPVEGVEDTAMIDVGEMSLPEKIEPDHADSVLEERAPELRLAEPAEGPSEQPSEQPFERTEDGPDDGVEEPVDNPPRTLVGTYESGGNIYTMYSDGSIDAQTPTGNYHFASLDELKNFIAEGGEDPLA